MHLDWLQSQKWLKNFLKNKRIPPSQSLFIKFLTLNAVPTNNLENFFSMQQRRGFIQDIYRLQTSKQTVYGKISFFVAYQAVLSLDRFAECTPIIQVMSALAILHKLGDPLQRVQKAGLLNLVKILCQRGFTSHINSQENDLRILLALLVICQLLSDYSPVDRPSAFKYITSCINYDGGIGLKPHCDSHSASAYCALACLRLLGEQLQEKQVLNLRFWLRCRTQQVQPGIIGFNSRPNKTADSCYSFWVPASLYMLKDCGDLDREAVKRFILGCRKGDGSISKYRSEQSQGDVVHTVFSSLGVRLLEGEEVWVQLGCLR